MLNVSTVFLFWRVKCVAKFLQSNWAHPWRKCMAKCCSGLGPACCFFGPSISRIAPHLLGGCRFSSIFWFHPTFCPPTFQKALPLSTWQLCQLQKSCLSRSTLGTELSETLHEEQQCWLWAELNSLSQGQRECCCVLGWSGLALGLRNVSQMPIFVIG